MPLERSNQQSAHTWILQIGLLPDGDMPRPLPRSHQQVFRIWQLRAPGEHEIDMCLMERDTADQAFVGAVNP